MDTDREEKLNHFDRRGSAVMVDVSEKETTGRFAAAEGTIKVNEKVMEAILDNGASKGDVLGVARIAGIMGTKKTSGLIPLCHMIPLTACTLDFEPDRELLVIRAICTAKTDGKTGVEMEALAGVSIALLTIYDMCKAMDRGMVISDIRLLEKSGGRSGHYRAG
ncbi:cyclic pyranopterin monophosphate synthase accessory protein [Spirochaetia bacterium]|nr:cyclic pyranopterin monophosphate synthase accessory protein [Spirochaetia bacterium]